MRISYLLVAVAAGLSTAAHATSTKFDLACEGSSEALNGSVKTVKPFVRTFHIDLDTSKYCIDSCNVINDILRADPLLITLVNVPRQGNAFNMRMMKQTIDRRTGELATFDFDAAKLRSVSEKAICTPKPFTPFPATKS